MDNRRFFLSRRKPRDLKLTERELDRLREKERTIERRRQRAMRHHDGLSTHHEK